MADITPKRDWHIEKSVSVGHLLTTVVIIVGMLTYFGEQDKRISSNELSIEFMKSQRSEDLRRIEKRLDLIDSKLDKIISASSTR
jgi:hypothetical protein